MDPTSTFTMTESPIRHKRARVSRACDQCRRKKIRCDADKSTPCTNCRTYGFGCSFLDSAKKRGPPKGYIEALENRLKRMEGLLGGLVDGVDKGSRPKKGANEERRRRRREDEDEDEDGDNSDEEDEDEDDADEDGEDDGEDDVDSASSSHSSQGRANGYRRQRRRNEVSSMNGASPLTGVDANRFQHLSALSSPPQTPEEVVEDINENLEKLNMEDYTQIRYVGNSSGLHLLTPQFEVKDGIFKLPQLENTFFPELSQCVQVKEEPGSGGDAGVTDFCDATSPPASHDLDFEVPAELSDRLIDLYFSNVHGVFPIVNKLHFLKQYRRELSTPPPPPLVLSMLAIASRYLPKDEPCGKPESLGLMFFERAKEALDQVYTYPRVSTVRALVLFSIFQNSQPEATRHWLDCGLAIRMAQELGLHRSSSRWKIPKSEIEARKRLWWACYVMDRWFGASFGRPLVISDDDCDVEYPSIYEEEDEDMLTPVSLSLGSFSPEPLMRSSSPIKKPSLAYKAFLEIIKISEILGSVLQAMYTPKARKRRSGHDKIIKNLDDKLTAWKVSLSQELQWQKDDTRNIESSPVIGSINLCYYTILILLHRPYIPSAKSVNLRSQFPSLRICTNAAVVITKISQCMNANKYFEMTWPFSVYNIFQSSMIHMHNTMSSNQDIARTAKSSLDLNVQILESLQNSFFAARKLSLLLGVLTSNSVSIEEPADGGFWVTVNEAGTSAAPGGPFAPKRNSKRSSYPSFPPANASPIADSRQRNRFEASNADAALPTSDMVPTQLPISPHVLSHTSLSMSAPSSNLVAMQPEPAFSLRQFAFASQPEYQRPVSIPATQPSPDDNMAFALDPSGGSGDMPNEYFRVDQSNPFYAMPSTYNVEDWDVWMVEHGSAGTMNVG